MRAETAIVESESARHVAAVDAALREYRGAQETFAVRRLALGRALVAARGCWPTRGPRAKGWGEFLAARGIDQDVALEAMKYAGYVDEDPESRDLPGNLPTRRQAGLDPDDDTGPRIIPADRDAGASAPPFRALGEADIIATMGELEQAMARLPLEAGKRVEAARRKARGVANLIGGSGEIDRGKWCTSDRWARAVGPVDLDPFSNPNSLVAARTRCMLENGGDGFGGVAPGSSPGLYLSTDRHGHALSGTADADTLTWIQPPYDIVLDVIAHYGHTRFIALLRFSPDVEWYRRLMPLTCAVAFPLERVAFKAPPGIPDPDAPIPYPHALYYADARDITPEVRALCQIWVVDHEQRPPLHIVR